jgi:acyl carrier protein
MNSSSISEEVRMWIVERALPGEDPSAVSEDHDLLGSGILDSLAIVQLLGHLRAHYGVVVSPEEVNLRNFGTARAIAAYIGSKREGRANGL